MKQWNWTTCSHFRALVFRPRRHFRLVRSAIIARPLDRFQTTIRCHISLFFSFSHPFHCHKSTHPPCTHIPSISFSILSPGFLLTNQWPYMLLTGPPLHCRRRTRFNLSIKLLLIVEGIRVNPGPSSSLNPTFGLLNTRSVVNKAPLLQCMIADNDFSFLALTETWVKTDDPTVIKNDPAPSGYHITHVHRDNPGLAVLHRDEINVLPRKHNTTHSSFEFQLS